jgi:hypothetical protein
MDSKSDASGRSSSVMPPSPDLDPFSISENEQRMILTSSTEEDSVRLPVPPETANTARTNVRHCRPEFGRLLRDYGHKAVIDIAFQRSKKAGNGFHRHQEYKSVHEWRLSGSQLLADVPMCLFQALLDGNLASKVFGDDPADAELCSYFGDSYWTIRGKGPFAPAHYVRIFTDDHGYPPTPEQLHTVLDGLRKYTSGSPVHDRFCAAVDRETGGNADTTSIRRGLHRLFDGSEARLQILLTFIYALQAHLDEIPPTEHRRPLPEPLKYVGFSLK